jgi:hypothetical protein
MMDVVIIRPEYANETFKFGILTDDKAMIKRGGKKCPHFTWEAQEAKCAIHCYKWYKRTPCYSHDQIPPDPKLSCRMGKFLKESYPDSKSEILKLVGIE